MTRKVTDMAIYAPNTRTMQLRRARLRRTVLLVALIAAVAVFGPRALSTTAFASDATGATVQLDTYTVSNGDTLWAIAANLTPQGRDVRDTVAEIKVVNAMTDSQLQAGQQILLPRVEG